MVVRVGRPADVLRQNEDAAHGGDGWVPRSGTMTDDLGRIWAGCGVTSECGTLRAVLMRSPGPEIDDVPDYRAALWLGEIDSSRAREQHAAFVAFYESHGFVAVQETDDDNQERQPDVRYEWKPG